MRCPCCNQKLCFIPTTGRKPTVGEVTACVTCAKVLVIECNDTRLYLRQSSQREHERALAAYPLLRVQRRRYLAEHN